MMVVALSALPAAEAAKSGAPTTEKSGRAAVFFFCLQVLSLGSGKLSEELRVKRH